MFFHINVGPWGFLRLRQHPTSCMEPFNVCYVFVFSFYFSLIKSPANSVVQENAAMLFCYEAPDMLIRLGNP